MNQQIPEDVFSIVEAAEKGQRLDQWLAIHHEGFSRTYFQSLIEDGLVLVNQTPVRKRYLVQSGDEIEVEFRCSEQLRLIPEDLPLNVIYEDEYILVLNKAPGMVVHPGAGQPGGTVANALAFRYGLTPLTPSDIRPGIVHRLDKDTSGLLITAKTLQVHAKLVEQFATRLVSKTYLAISCKMPPPAEVNLAIERDPNHRQRMKAGREGKSAITRFTTLASMQGLWPLHALSVQLLTGRTHQIRVHLRACDCPLLGDSVYGWSSWNDHYKTPRQLLHAWKLGLRHPVTGLSMEWTAPIPQDIVSYLDSIDRALIGRL